MFELALMGGPSVARRAGGRTPPLRNRLYSVDALPDGVDDGGNSLLVGAAYVAEAAGVADEGDDGGAT